MERAQKAHPLIGKCMRPASLGFTHARQLSEAASNNAMVAPVTGQASPAPMIEGDKSGLRICEGRN